MEEKARMKLIVGLGNPGKRYAYTRHNIGYIVLEKLVKRKLSVRSSLRAWKKEKKMMADVCQIDGAVGVKPETYMNISGKSVAAVMQWHKIAAEDVWVVHDDIDLPLGKIRIRRGGGSAGHRGVESIIREIGQNEFWRIRLGIGRGKLDTIRHTDRNLPRQEVEKYVVSSFRDSEAGEVKKLIKHAVEALEIALDEGMERAMNRFN